MANQIILGGKFPLPELPPVLCLISLELSWSISLFSPPPPHHPLFYVIHLLTYLRYREFQQHLGEFDCHLGPQSCLHADSASQYGIDVAPVWHFRFKTGSWMLFIDYRNSNRMAAVYTAHTSSIRIFYCFYFPDATLKTWV